MEKNKEIDNKKDDIKEERTQLNKKSLIICVAVLLIVVSIVFAYKINKDKNDYIDNSSYSDKEDAQENKNDNSANKNENNEKNKYQKTTYHIDISSNEIFTKKQEDKYINYARKTKIDDTGTYIYEIKEDKVYATKKGDSSVVTININNETPKYLESGADCGGVYVYILTKEGNIYGGYEFDPTKIENIYSQKNAEEIVRINESKIFTTCGEVSVYALANSKLYYTYYSSVTDNLQNYKSREETHPFSIAYPLGQNDYTKAQDYDGHNWPKVLVYPNGTLNKYIYDYQTDTKYINEFIKNSNGEDLYVSFMYNYDEKLYIVDTNGYVYNVPTLNNYSGTELTELSLINIYEGKKVKYIDLEVEYLKMKYRFDDYTSYSNPKMTLIFDDNTKQEYLSNLSFDKSYINK